MSVAKLRIRCPSEDHAMRLRSDRNQPKRGFSIPNRRHGSRKARSLFLCAALLLTIRGAGPTILDAEPILPGGNILGSAMSSEPAEAIALDSASRTLTDVKEAVKRFEAHDFDACLAQFAKARKLHPELPPAEALFAKLAFLSNQGQLIRPALERAVAADPEHPEIYILFGNLALAEGRLTDASLHFEKAKALAADKRWTAEQRSQFELFCYQGCAQLAEHRRDWKAARAALEPWLKHQPANGAARQRLGRALFGLGESKGAYQELQQACKTDRSLEPAAVAMGWLFTASGDRDQAGKWMDYAVKTGADSLAVQTGVAAWLLEQGRVDEAQRRIDAAARLDPQSGQVKKLTGLVARQRKDFAAAEQTFHTLADESPADPWARNQLALVLAEQNEPAKRKRALDLAELSVRLTPKAADALATLGTVDYRLGRNEDAQKILEAVLASGNGTSDSAYILARVREARGQADAIPKLLKTALGASGIFIDRKDAQDWLDRLTAKSAGTASRREP
jgi:Tfp pilus assembly protein PilF